MNKPLLIAVSLFLAACSSTQGNSYQNYFDQKGLGIQTPEAFQNCRGYGCKFIDDISLPQSDWNEITRAYGRPKTPEAERESIKRTVALFEQKVGAINGTAEDHWGTFRKLGDKQQDCVDESTNTTVYLTLLAQKGLLKFHTVEPPTARFPLIHAGRWPHQTAVISQNDTSEFFVVDSWFHNNGVPPEIVPLKQWKEGWKPDRNDDETQ